MTNKHARKPYAEKLRAEECKTPLAVLTVHILLVSFEPLDDSSIGLKTALTQLI